MDSTKRSALCEVSAGALLNKALSMHRKIGEFLHDIRAIDAIKITEPFFCDASYNQIGKLGTLMVHIGVG